MRARCAECGRAQSLEPYMVLDATWREAKAKQDDLLHLACLAARLGRRLTVADFTEAPINRLILFGAALPHDK